MKNNRLFLIITMILTLVANSQLFAKVYAPNTNRDITGSKKYCQSATPSNIRFRYYTCNSGTGTSSGTPITIKWYKNSTNSTTGGVVVSTTSANTTASTTGSVYYTPSTATPGVSYYYCEITWSATGTCNTTGSLKSTLTSAVTVGEVPSTITGNSTICMGTPTTMTNTSTGGTWKSSNTGRATVGLTTGVVNGVTIGTARITFTALCGTRVSKPISVVNATTVNAISGGTSKICAGSTTNLTNTTSGGVWSSENTAIATISTSGVVRGIAPGTVNISYTVTGSCESVFATKTVTVTTTPAAITGIAISCNGYSFDFENTVPFGVWSSSNTSVATIDSETGSITSTGAGTVTIAYNTGCGTQATKTHTVNAGPTPITGSRSICAGATSILDNITSDGTWSSANTAVATINTTTGIMTGIAMGTATISYRDGACSAIATVTINAIPTAITGSSNICTGTNTLLGNSALYGTWTSSNSTTGTINAAGRFYGLNSGTTTISYNTGCGSAVAKIITVNTQPAAITGAASICEGSSSIFTNTTTGGIWSSSNNAIGSVNATTGAVNGIAEGIANITYTIGICTSTAEVEIDPLPVSGIISGTTTLCEDDETNFTTTGDEGTWTSSNNAVATIDADGVLSALAGGTANITYTATNTCGTTITTTNVTVTPTPNAGTITGASSMCTGVNSTLGNAQLTGIWSSSNITVATVSTTGVVTPLTTGNTSISYTVTNGCGTDIAETAITVNALPNAGAISGSSNICNTATTALTNTVNGGVWSSSNTSVATISAGGTVRGITPGTTTISYRVSNSCGIVYATKIVTVSPLATGGTITGTASVCASATTALSNLTTGGAWTSSNTAIATIGTNGVVSGIAAGTTTISYTVTNGCGTASTSKIVTVYPLPNAGSIIGATTVCELANTSLNNITTGGVWSSSNNSVASVGTTGIVSGLVAGTSTITYAVSNSCGTTYTAVVVTVNPQPVATSISGATSVCVAATTPMTNITTGGTWSSSNASAATISAAGFVSGIAQGTTQISYQITNGCGTTYASKTITVNPLPAAGMINGVTSICPATTSALTSTVTGGTWSSSNTTVAQVGTDGVVTGATMGTSNITFTATNVCGTAIATTTVTVGTTPTVATITGTTSVCVSGTLSLSNATTGGNWSSSDNAVATVNGAGLVTPITAGTTTISYTISNSCGTVAATKTITINPSAVSGTMTGNTNICVLGTSVMTGTTGTGLWTSSNAAIASVNASGVVTGKTAGTARISYTVSNACGTTMTSLNVSVSTLSSAITGVISVCANATTTLNSLPAGGTWSSSNTAVGTMGTSIGIVTGLTAGTTVISYNRGGCVRMATVTVKAVPNDITGNPVLCMGQPVSVSLLANSTPGGTWVSSNAAKLAVSPSTGVMKGLSTGTATITYKMTTGCYSTKVVTINGAVAAVSGLTKVCTGAEISLGNVTPGGTWITSNALKATIDPATGVLTGVAAGTATATYIISAGCYKTLPITVSQMPSYTNTNDVVCQGITTILTAAPAGGSWITANAAKATVTRGSVKGISAGSVNITYKMATGCQAVREMTVNAVPAAISGNAAICTGSTETLASTTTGGTWTSANITRAIADGATGNITGIAAGTVAITYALPTGCVATRIATVNATPLTITGNQYICVDNKTTLASYPAAGTWSSTNTAIATVVPTTGIVTALSEGTVTISYRNAKGCASTAVVTVNPAITAITGTPKLCLGQPYSVAILSNATPGGVWCTNDSAKVIINPSNGYAKGTIAGTATVSYKLANGCYSSVIVTVSAAVPAITGSTTVCQGATATLTNSLPAGTWSTSNTNVAVFNTPTGLITGVSAGTTIVTYTVSAGCFRTSVQTVNASAATLTGSTIVAVGANTAFTSSLTGGTWSSSNCPAASISASGMATGVSAGATTITYKFANGCFSTRPLSVASAKEDPTPVNDEPIVVIAAAEEVNETVKEAVTEVVNEEVAETIKLNINMYPNPTSGAFTVEAPVAGSFTMFSIDGKMVGQFAINGTTTINMPYGLTAGMYMCQFVAENGEAVIARLVYRP